MLHDSGNALKQHPLRFIKFIGLLLLGLFLKKHFEGAKKVSCLQVYQINWHQVWSKHQPYTILFGSHRQLSTTNFVLHTFQWKVAHKCNFRTNHLTPNGRSNCVECSVHPFADAVNYSVWITFATADYAMWYSFFGHFTGKINSRKANKTQEDGRNSQVMTFRWWKMQKRNTHTHTITGKSPGGLQRWDNSRKFICNSHFMYIH